MELTVHIGAHRTGSTLVAQAITRSVAACPEAGVTVWHPRHMRDIDGFQAVPRLIGPGGDPVSVSAKRMLARTTTQLDEDAETAAKAGTRHLVISEENLMGTMRGNMAAASFYPDIAARLRAYATVLPQTPDRVALGVRDYGAVVSSAFNYIPQRGKEAPSREAARAIVLNGTRGWTEILSDVYSVWPDVEIYLWQQEHLSTHAASICAGLLGLPVDKIILPSGRVNPLKSGDDAEPLFSSQERAALSARYADDMARLLRSGTDLGQAV